MHGSKSNKNPSWRSHEVAVAIQVIPNIMRDLIRILNEFSIKICLYLDGHGAKRRLAMTTLVAMQQRSACAGPCCSRHLSIFS
ncbi:MULTISPECIES: hypothetical protein [unclassified Rickettsia]|uniref:hypothetical protein n=1 Tax=unclassified Rickettsia TaxID=114295 RepID=UPI003132A9A7